MSFWTSIPHILNNNHFTHMEWPIRELGTPAPNRLRHEAAKMIDMYNFRILWMSLGHGCAKVAHCYTAPTTVAHYVSMTCSEHREALIAAPTADGVHKQAIRV